MTPDRSRWLDALLNDVTLRVCAVFTLAMVLMPPEGLGVEMCLSKRATEAPCPGCGMTRCGANLARGHFVRAVQYHPFGLLVVPAIAGLGLLGLAPRRWRQGARGWLAARRALRPIWWVGLGGFFLFGIVRWVCVVTGVAGFPAGWPP
jgi:hypothetical protein